MNQKELREVFGNNAIDAIIDLQANNNEKLNKLISDLEKAIIVLNKIKEHNKDVADEANIYINNMQKVINSFEIFKKQ
jgi:lipoate-protein ligase B